MLSNNKIKFIKSLKNKKYRDNSSKFVAEGDSLVADLLQFYPTAIDEIFATINWIENQANQSFSVPVHETPVETLRKASLFQSPSQAIALCRIPAFQPPQAVPKVCLFADGIQDPGNMGTIFRTAAWFNVDAIFYNDACADPFNPKTFRSSMGAILQIPSFKTDIQSWRQQFPNIPLLGAQMQGIPLQEVPKTESFALVLGNEGKGLSPETQKILTQSVTIPKKGQAPIESLNVGIATAILLYTLSN